MGWRKTLDSDFQVYTTLFYPSRHGLPITALGQSNVLWATLGHNPNFAAVSLNSQIPDEVTWKSAVKN